MPKLREKIRRNQLSRSHKRILSLNAQILRNCVDCAADLFHDRIPGAAAEVVVVVPHHVRVRLRVCEHDLPGFRVEVKSLGRINEKSGVEG